MQKIGKIVCAVLRENWELTNELTNQQYQAWPQLTLRTVTMETMGLNVSPFLSIETYWNSSNLFKTFQPDEPLSDYYNQPNRIMIENLIFGSFGSPFSNNHAFYAQSKALSNILFTANNCLALLPIRIRNIRLIQTTKPNKMPQSLVFRSFLH